MKETRRARGHEILDEDECTWLASAATRNNGPGRVQQLRVSFSIISILAGCFTLVRPGLEQQRAGRDRLGLPILAAFILLVGLSPVRTGVSLPDVGRNLLVGSQSGWAQGGLLHRLAEPHRVVIAILASVAYGSATFLDRRWAPSAKAGWPAASLTRVFVMFLVILVVVAVINIFSSHLPR